MEEEQAPGFTHMKMAHVSHRRASPGGDCGTGLDLALAVLKGKLISEVGSLGSGRGSPVVTPPQVSSSQ